MVIELIFTTIALNENLRINKLFDFQYENILGYLLITVCMICLLVSAMGNIIVNIKYYKKYFNKYNKKNTVVNKIK